MNRTFLNKKKLLVIFFSGLVSLYFFFHKNSSKSPPALPKIVETETINPRPLTQTITLIGTIRAKHTAVLAAKETGVLDILQTSGQNVKKGDLIAQITNADIEKRYQLSKVTEEIAQQQYERIKNLKKAGYFSPREIDEKKQSLIDAQKELARTRVEFDKLRFYAPFDGIVGAFKIREGAQVNAGESIVTVYDPDSITVEIDIPCTNLPDIQVQQPAYVFNQLYQLNHYQKMIDDETHMCPADIDIQCPQCLIGSSIKVELVVKEKPHTFIVPSQALLLRNGKPHLYKIVDKKVELTPVKTDIHQKDTIEIVSGLQAGDQIIIKGTERVYPGMEVIAADQSDNTLSG